MTRHSTAGPELVVVGAGVIGMSCAWRAAAAGWRVRVIDPEPGRGASWVAGGMLAPITEAWPGEEDLFTLGVASLDRWRDFAEELGRDSGVGAGLRHSGTVVAAATPGDRAELDMVAAHLALHGCIVQRLSAAELRKVEPALGPDMSGGLVVPGDLAVDNRSLLEALRAACDLAGVTFVYNAVYALDGGSVSLRGDERLGADAVLIAAGAYSAMLHPALKGLIRPVKGEIVRLRYRASALPPPRRTVRAVVHGSRVYAVPRELHGLVVGATEVENGFDTEVTVGGLRGLLRDIERVLPGVSEYEIAETAAGLRPGSPDNLPLVGRLGGSDGLAGPLVATGHYRNGLLLAPITADGILALLTDRPPPPELAVADPARFAAVSR